MTKQKIEIEVEVPEGWQLTGRHAQKFAVLPDIAADDRRGTINMHLAVEPIVKYRTPTQADVGRMVEVSDNGVDWLSRNLLAVLPGERYSRFISDDTDDTLDFQCWNHARIIDDGQAKVPIEAWANVYPDRFPAFHYTKTDADRCCGGDRIRCVRMVEAT